MFRGGELLLHTVLAALLERVQFFTLSVNYTFTASQHTVLPPPTLPLGPRSRRCVLSAGRSVSDTRAKCPAWLGSSAKKGSRVAASNPCFGISPQWVSSWRRAPASGQRRPSPRPHLRRTPPVQSGPDSAPGRTAGPRGRAAFSVVRVDA